MAEVVFKSSIVLFIATFAQAKAKITQTKTRTIKQFAKLEIVSFKRTKKVQKKFSTLRQNEE